VKIGSTRSGIPDGGQTLRLPSLLPFLLITFCLAWAILTLLILVQDGITAIFGELSARHPLFILAVYAPAIATIILVLAARRPRSSIWNWHLIRPRRKRIQDALKVRRQAGCDRQRLAASWMCEMQGGRGQ